MMPHERCKNCRFWNFDGEAWAETTRGIADHLSRQCRRESPAVDDKASPVWPFTLGKDWCGEFMPIIVSSYASGDLVPA